MTPGCTYSELRQLLDYRRLLYSVQEYVLKKLSQAGTIPAAIVFAASVTGALIGARARVRGREHVDGSRLLFRDRARVPV